MVFKETLKRLVHLTWETKSTWLRAIICGLIGFSALHFDENDRHDLRFIARGQQEISDQIVLINIPKNQMARFSNERVTLIKDFPEFSQETSYWDQTYWEKLLKKLIKAEPQSVVVSLFFDKNLRSTLREKKQSIFYHKKLFWMSYSDDEGKTHYSLFANRKKTNTGIGNLIFDPDRMVRRFSFSQKESLPHIAEAAVSSQSYSTPDVRAPMLLINFQGPINTFKTINASTVLNGGIDTRDLKNKIIIIGAMDSPSQHIQTPLGGMSRAEVFANIVENISQKKWIKRLDTLWYSLYLLLLLGISIIIMYKYSQTVAFILVTWLMTASTAFSMWTFDTFNLWVPVLSACIEIFAVFVIFNSLQLALKEKIHWKLTQETRTAQELEQLKNNFVSLFSHDLKTPIAKIHAIIDRLLAQGSLKEHQADLVSLRRSSDELYNYIQKILQVSRVESKKFKLKKDVADLNDVIESVISQVSPLAKEKGIYIRFEPEPLFSIDMDRTLIKEVILNLLDNAIKYSPEGSTVHIFTNETDECVEFTIQDSGDGISPEEQRKIWRKFYRSTKHGHNTKGSGLGLYLVKYFIELHGGEIETTSVVGQGTTMKFTLPFEIDEPTISDDFDLVPEHDEEINQNFEMRWQ